MEGGGDQEEQGHTCKLCRKSFPCGRSLGGHMRAHVSSNWAPSAEADGEPALPSPQTPLQSQSSKWVPGFHGGGGRGARYVLRENPKKTWRMHDSVDAAISPAPGKLCKECGRGFPSWRALFGHMRCHPHRSSSCTMGRQKEPEQAEEAREQEEEEEEEEVEAEAEEHGDGSWDSSAANKVLAPGMAMPRRGRVRGRSKRVPAVMAVAAAPALPASEIRQELEDVALCLMMLSRDMGFWGGLHSISESSDRSSMLKEVEASTAREELRVCLPDGKQQMKKNKNKNKNEPCEVEDSDDDGELSRDSAKRPRLRRALAELGGANSKLERSHLIRKEKFDAHKQRWGRDHGGACDGSSAKSPHRKSSFECPTCGKAFRSYQALGGHQTSHNRTKSSPAPKADGGENTDETAVSTAAEEDPIRQAMGVAEEASSGSQRKASHHECGICLRVFPSGQALGGHKRCHLSGAACRRTVVIQEHLTVASGVLDLNLPAPAADGDSSVNVGQLGSRPWWVGREHQGKPLVRLVPS